MKSASFGRKPFETPSNIGLQIKLTPCIGILRPVTPSHVAKVISRHERSPGVFSAITFDRYKLEQWKHGRCVEADDTDRLICTMTFSDQVMTFTFSTDYMARSNYSSFDASWPEKHDNDKMNVTFFFFAQLPMFIYSNMINRNDIDQYKADMVLSTAAPPSP